MGNEEVFVVLREENVTEVTSNCRGMVDAWKLPWKDVENSLDHFSIDMVNRVEKVSAERTDTSDFLLDVISALQGIIGGR